MPFVRISLMTPKAGQLERARELLEALARHHEQQAGYVDGYTLVGRDGGGEIGRVSVWAAEEHANRVAATDHDLSLRSELNLVVEPDSRRESSFDGVPSPPASG